MAKATLKVMLLRATPDPDEVVALGARIGIVTVPVENAQEVADSLVETGVKALWNYTPYRIRVADDIVVQNTSIYAHLAVMYNRLNLNKDK